MREYDEKTLQIAERVRQRSDEIIRQRKIKAAKRRHITYSVSGLCAAAVLCFGIINLSKYSKESNTSFHGSHQNTTTDMTIEHKGTETSTTTETATTTAVATATVTTDTTSTVTTTAIEETTVQSQTSETAVRTTAAETLTTATTTTTTTTKSPETTTTKAVTTAVTTKAVIVQPTECGDVNGDGKVDIEDFEIIRNYVYRDEGTTWEEFYKGQSNLDPDYAEQALANADTYRPSDKREITMDDANAVMGKINGLYPNLPIYMF